MTVNPANDWGYQWSPDGQEIAFVSYSNGDSDIWIIPAGGGTARQVTFQPGTKWALQWSPDGKWLLFSSQPKGKSAQVWRVPAAGGGPEQLTVEERGGSFNGIWSSDGNKAYFTGYRERERNLYEAPAEGGVERQLTDLSGRYDSGIVILATDGKYIYFRFAEDLGDIWVMDVIENK